jgi:hypothetical protein
MSTNPIISFKSKEDGDQPPEGDQLRGQEMQITPSLASRMPFNITDKNRAQIESLNRVGKNTSGK